MQVAHELDREHRSQPTHISDRGPARLPLPHARPHNVPDGYGAGDELFLLEDVEDRERRRQCDRVTDERSADGSGVRAVDDMSSTDDSRKREPAGQRFRDDHEIGLHVEVLHREHAARTAESGLDLVSDEHDPVSVTQVA